MNTYKKQCKTKGSCVYGVSPPILHFLGDAELQELLAVPPYTVGRELSPANLWIGTRGTVTSLHSDPSDNLLCQVAGYKYFRLYGLDQTPRLYATVQRGNNTNSFGTSPVRVEAPIPPEPPPLLRSPHNLLGKPIVRNRAGQFPGMYGMQGGHS